MGKVLTIADIEKMAVAKEMPLGTIDAVFESMEYKLDENQEDIKGTFLHFEGFRSIYLPFTDGKVNYQLDYLLEQLGVDSYSPAEINAKEGTSVKISRYLKETTKDYTPAEYTAFKQKFEGAPPTYMEILENEDGSATVKSVFTNTNFNLNTIK